MAAGRETLGASLHTLADDGQNLVLTGHDGFTPQITRFDTVPISWDLPVTRAFRAGTMLFFAGDELDRLFPMLGAVDSMLATASGAARIDDCTLIAIPSVYSGRLLGVCSIIARPDGPWTWADFAHLDGLGSAISLWQEIENLTRRQVTVNAAGRAARMSSGGLSSRQLAILSLIQSGKTNASIAKALGYSLSTVKLEIQRPLSLLMVSDRRELVRKALLAGLFPTGGDAPSE